MTISISKAVEDYTSIKPVYESFSLRIRALLEDILTNSNIKFHLIEARAKDSVSFRDKITRKGHKYLDPLKEITDLCGCRIIVYYRDDVGRVSEAIKDNFIIAEENLSRQPHGLEADRFGYLSAHYIVTLHKSRIDLVEWRRYTDFKVEIQIRTVVEHAWSAISHAIQYKQESGIPSKLQRRLNRLAGLFELVDDEFVGIRDDREKIIANVKHEISKGSKSITLSSVSIIEFFSALVHTDEIVKVADNSGFEIISDEINDVSLIYDLCQELNITNLDELASSIYPIPEIYLKSLISDSKNNGTSQWQADTGFIISLILIYRARKIINSDFLLDYGFGEDIADQIINVARGTD